MIPPADTAFDQLLDAWLLWDTHPAAPWTATNYLEAANNYAHHIGANPIELRRFLAAGRRQHLPHDQIIANARNPNHPGSPIRHRTKDQAA